MASSYRPGDQESVDDAIVAEINITPLTDVFLVLLIIFMVTTSVVASQGKGHRQQIVCRLYLVARGRVGLSLFSGISSRSNVAVDSFSMLLLSEASYMVVVANLLMAAGWGFVVE